MFSLSTTSRSLARWLLPLAVVTAVAFTTAVTGDYSAHGPVSGDNAGPALSALAHLRLTGFVQTQPLMGLTSLLLRAPFVALASALGASALTVYQVGAFACLVPCALLAGWLIYDRGSSLRGIFSAGLAAYVVLLAPTTLSAIGSGHPEEVLAASLATAAVLAAGRDKTVWSGLALGAAIGTKEWTIVAAAPALLALSHGRVRAALVAGATSVVLLAPPVLANPSAFSRAASSLGSTHLVGAMSAWWPLSSRPPSLPAGAPLVAVLPVHLDKSVALGLVLVLVLAGATAGWTWATMRGRAPDALALLALLGLVRYVGDPGPVEYYALAVLVPVAVWESASLRRIPAVALIALGAVVVSWGPATHLSAGLVSAVTAAWTVPLAGYLAARWLRLERPAGRPLRFQLAGR